MSTRSKIVAPEVRGPRGQLPALGSWPVLSLDSVAEVRLGRQRSPKNHSGDQMRPYLRAANVGRHGLKLDDVKQMNFNDREMETYRLRPGDLVLGEASGSRTEVGKPAIWSGEIPDCAFRNTLIRVRPREADSRFLLHFLRHQAESGQFAERSRGVGIYHLGRTVVADLPVPVPPIEEQRRIAAILDQADEIRAKRCAALGALGTLTESIFLDMFGDPSGHPRVAIETLVVYTDFEDEEGEPVSVAFRDLVPADELERFRRKATAFLREHDGVIAIKKLRHNWPITADDMAELQRVLVDAGVGTADDCALARAEAGSFGIFVRSLIGLDRATAKKAFGEFLGGSTWSGAQIEFVNLIILRAQPARRRRTASVLRVAVYRPQPPRPRGALRRRGDRPDGRGARLDPGASRGGPRGSYPPGPPAALQAMCDATATLVAHGRGRVPGASQQHGRRAAPCRSR